MLLWHIYWVTQKAASFEWGPEQEEALKQVQSSVQAFLPLGPCDPQVHWNLKQWNRGAVWSIWQTHTGELHPSGFWIKALPSSIDNYSPLEKYENKPLVYYGILVETEHLPIGLRSYHAVWAGCYLSLQAV